MVILSVEPAGVVKDRTARLTPAFGMGMGGEGASPGDVAMAGGVEGITALGESSLVSVVRLAQREIVGRDVGLGFGEALLGDGELVHEGEAEVMLFGGEIHFHESARVMLSGLPTNLAAEAGLVAGGLKVGEVFQEMEQDGFEEVPVFGAAGEKGAEPEL